MASKSCCICGRNAYGKQWWNRDKGFGLCIDCAEKWIGKTDRQEFERSYGRAGVHWGAEDRPRAGAIAVLRPGSA